MCYVEPYYYRRYMDTPTPLYSPYPHPYYSPYPYPGAEYHQYWNARTDAMRGRVGTHAEVEYMRSRAEDGPFHQLCQVFEQLYPLGGEDTHRALLVHDFHRCATQVWDAHGYPDVGVVVYGTDGDPQVHFTRSTVRPGIDARLRCYLYNSEWVADLRYIVSSPWSVSSIDGGRRRKLVMDPYALAGAIDLLRQPPNERALQALDKVVAPNSLFIKKLEWYMGNPESCRRIATACENQDFGKRWREWAESIGGTPGGGGDLHNA